MPDKPKKQGFDKLGYGALALYAALVGLVALGVYGINVSTTIMDQNRSDRARAQVQTGRMLMTTADRTQCRSMNFNNETVEFGREALIDCDPNTIATDPGGSAFSTMRDGFMKR
jgi:Na+/glutamate symporter